MINVDYIGLFINLLPDPYQRVIHLNKMSFGFFVLLLAENTAAIAIYPVCFYG